MTFNIYAACGALVCILCAGLLLKQLKPEYAPLLAGAGAILMGARLLLAAAEQLSALTDIAGEYGLGGWLSLLCKALGIAAACQLTADLCRDCGETALAGKAELCGKLSILALTVPVVKQLLETL